MSSTIKGSTSSPPSASVSRSSRKMWRLLQYRRGGSPGYWCAFLLPLAIYLADIKFNYPSFHAVVILLYNAILLSLFHFCDLIRPDVFHNYKCVNIVLGFLIILQGYFKGGVLYEYASYAVLNYSFPYIFQNFIKHYPNSFTFGEGMIVTSAFVYMFWSTSQNLVSSFTALQDSPEPVILTLIIGLAFLGVILIARILLMISKPYKFFGLEEFFCLWTKATFIAFTFKLNNTADDIWFLVYWVAEFLFGSWSRWTYLLGWSGCVTLGVWFISNANSVQNVATTVDRKFFHLLVCVVYLPAIFRDFNLIYFCSAIVLFGFLIIEAARALQLTILEFNFGDVIDSCVSHFRDSRDDGKLILTPIYLLAGCSMPIWLTGLYYQDNYILTAEEIAGALSGVLSIGIGDTFASIGGYYFGRTKWEGTSKTVEGTVCSIVAQILFVVLFCVMDFMPYTALSLTALGVSCVINALVEAWTDQIDNLVLPLVAFNCIYGVKFLNENMFYSALY